jgi:hypothetical protein
MVKLCYCNVPLDYAFEPKAIFKWSDRETCDGQIEMGNGV